MISNPLALSSLHWGDEASGNRHSVSVGREAFRLLHPQGLQRISAGRAQAEAWPERRLCYWRERESREWAGAAGGRAGTSIVPCGGHTPNRHHRALRRHTGLMPGPEEERWDGGVSSVRPQEHWLWEEGFSWCFACAALQFPGHYGPSVGPWFPGTSLHEMWIQILLHQKTSSLQSMWEGEKSVRL